MAVKKEIEIIIEADGTFHLETRGLKGVECDDDLKPFEQSMGRVKEKKRTAEFYEKIAARKLTTTSRK